MIDLHTHVYWGGTSLGVDAADVARRSGTTTFVDAGSAGPGNFHGFRRHVIEPSPLRIVPYLNLSFPGIFALSATVAVGECAAADLHTPGRPETMGSIEALARRAVALDGADAEARSLLSNALWRRADYEGALAEAERALGITPNLASGNV